MDEITGLAGAEPTRDEGGERGADIANFEEFVTETNDAGGKEDGIARLVASEASIVEEGGDVLHANGEGKDEELEVEEDRVIDVGVDPAASWRSALRLFCLVLFFLVRIR